MGCNLCTLQKREEHYKLLYEIAQGGLRVWVSQTEARGVTQAWPVPERAVLPVRPPLTPAPASSSSPASLAAL
ncbi:hypothetical protein AALO_G00159750 [Alosa alosa]|uniref:Uncharacterized protein n=1 Tax=Alosa alosa TaxID=278164 RepID=A0AAV6GMV0_9TELE|nr:hypothetical protein AALO_G00159750 [Alosa alosa]